MSHVNHNFALTTPNGMIYSQQINNVDHEKKVSGKQMTGHRTSSCKDFAIVVTDQAIRTLNEISENIFSPLNSLANLSKCTICLETFRDPRMLRCGHVFENSVLEEIRRVAEDQSAEESSNKSIKIIINPKCPSAGCGPIFTGREIYPAQLVLHYMNAIVEADNKIKTIFAKISARDSEIARLANELNNKEIQIKADKKKIERQVAIIDDLVRKVTTVENSLAKVTQERDIARLALTEEGRSSAFNKAKWSSRAEGAVGIISIPAIILFLVQLASGKKQ